MSSRKWSEAAKLFREQSQDLLDQDSQSPVRTTDIESAERKLASFWDSPDGRAAKALLGASGRYVTFARVEADNGTASIFLLSASGPCVWIGVSDGLNLHAPRRPVSMATRAGVALNPNPGNLTVDTIITWLYAELDKIADTATKG